MSVGRTKMPDTGRAVGTRTVAPRRSAQGATVETETQLRQPSGSNFLAFGSGPRPPKVSVVPHGAHLHKARWTVAGSGGFSGFEEVERAPGGCLMRGARPSQADPALG